MKTICITGASGGMGSATCHLLLDSGYSIIALDHNQQRLSKLADQLPADRFQAVCLDLADSDFCQTLSSIFLEADGFYGIVNFAGISKGEHIEKLEDQDWEESLAVNVTAPMKLARLAAPIMRARGGGVIINVSSPVGFVGARKPSYAASKAAMHGLTLSLARNLGSYNIRTNTLVPGTAITHMTKDWSEQKRQAVAGGLFLGRLCETVEIAKVIRFLVSEDASYLCGSLIDMSCGGMLGH